MTENQLTPMENLKEKVTSRIRESISDLIPDEVFSGIIDVEIRNFRDNAIPRLVKEALEQNFKDRIRALLNEPEYVQKWSGADYVPGDAVKEIVRQLAPDLTAAVFASVVDQAVQTMRQQIGNTF